VQLNSREFSSACADTLTNSGIPSPSRLGSPEQPVITPATEDKTATARATVKNLKVLSISTIKIQNTFRKVKSLNKSPI
jgi:hypothetical protein